MFIYLLVNSVWKDIGGVFLSLYMGNENYDNNNGNLKRADMNNDLSKSHHIRKKIKEVHGSKMYALKI